MKAVSTTVPRDVLMAGDSAESMVDHWDFLSAERTARCLVVPKVVPEADYLVDSLVVFVVVWLASYSDFLLTTLLVASLVAGWAVMKAMSVDASKDQHLVLKLAD